MLSRKHYVKLAEALRRSKSIADAASMIADFLQEDNPRFDRGRFLAAAQVVEETEGTASERRAIRSLRMVPYLRD